MKFGKTYSEFIEKEAGNQLAGCSYVEFKRLKKVLKTCTVHDSSSAGDDIDISTPTCSSLHSCGSMYAPASTTSGLEAMPCTSTKKISRKGSPVGAFTRGGCPSSCPGCDAKFFGELMEELLEVEGCFNSRAEQLVKLHMATGFRKYIKRGKRNNRESMKQEGQLLINYATMNAIAVRKILRKYDKIYRSREGGIFKSQLTAMRGELLKSPYLVELVALHLNLADAKENTSTVTELVGEFSINFEDSTPILSCKLLESATLDFDLTCPICLAGVYPDAVKLKQLSLLIKNRCPEYWKDRFQREREQQLKLKKEFYGQQMEVLLGTRKAMLGF